MTGLKLVSFGALSGFEDAHPSQVLTGRFRLNFRRELMLCDKCGGPADAVHFLDDEDCYPFWSSPTKVMFSCGDHDFGGYWVGLDELLDPGKPGGRGFLSHIAEKSWGLAGLAALGNRLVGDREKAFDVWLDANVPTPDSSK